MGIASVSGVINITLFVNYLLFKCRKILYYCQTCTLIEHLMACCDEGIIFTQTSVIADSNLSIFRTENRHFTEQVM